MKLDSRLDPYFSLQGDTLSQHFHFMDRMLWSCLYTIGQTEPEYLQKIALEPIIRQASGNSHGRRWYIRGQNTKFNGQLVDAVRVWVQTDDWHAFIEELQWLQLYRDTLREWIESFESAFPRIQSHMDHWMRNYYKFRGEITEAYLPLVHAVSSSYGFSDDAKADLFQIGTTGLVHAIERYHNVGPMTFPSFAKRWVRQRILMAISRQLPMIRVSHSVLEAQSRINRDERRRGKQDDSDWARRIKSLSAAKDVVLIDNMSIGGAFAAKEEDESRLTLTEVPANIRQILLIKYDILNKAQSNHTPDELKKERVRQIASYLEKCKRLTAA